MWRILLAKYGTYYLAADEVIWDYAPGGINKITGQPFGDAESFWVASGPHQIGKVVKEGALPRIHRRNLYSTETPPKAVGAPGLFRPAAEAEVGDTIQVTFKNNLGFPVSMHPQGVFYKKDSEGAVYRDGSGDESNQAVLPGTTGATPPSYLSCPSCSNGVQDGLETDVDCGGSTCGACAVGRLCQQNSDCQTGLCSGGTCQNFPTNPAASCPGYGTPNDNVVWDVSANTCTFSCQGEHYDVNGNPADGCEIADSPTGNHTQSSAVRMSDQSICDAAPGGVIQGTLISDSRIHENPSVTGFDAVSGSAPDWYVVKAVDTSQFGTCQSDLRVTLAVMNSASPSCYHLQAVTATGGYSDQTDNTGTLTLSYSGLSYPCGSDVYFTISITCSIGIARP